MVKRKYTIVPWIQKDCSNGGLSVHILMYVPMLQSRERLQGQKKTAVGNIYFEAIHDIRDKVSYTF